MKRKPIRIIVDGLDRTGKTSLVDILAEELKIPVWHFGVPPEDNPSLFYLKELSIANERDPDGFILDRYIFSNHAYSGIFGGGVIPIDDYHYIMEVTAKQNFYPIILIDDPAKIFLRIQKEYQEFVIEHKAGRISDDFEPKGHELSILALTEIQNRFIEQLGRSPFKNYSILNSSEVLDHSDNTPSKKAPELAALIHNISEGVAKNA